MKARNGAVRLARKLAAEGVGTFFVTLTACSVDDLYYTGDQADFVSRWLARGAVVTVLIYALSEISGAHLNPVVSLAFLVRRAMPAGLALGYWVMQFTGGVAGGALTMVLWKGAAAYGASHPGTRYSHLEAAVTEAILTFFVVSVILLTADEEAAVGKQAAIAVGLCVAVCGFFAGPISGASMNPARSIPIQLLTGQASIAWIYLAGPIAGAVLAALAAFAMEGPPDHHERKAAAGKNSR